MIPPNTSQSKPLTHPVTHKGIKQVQEVPDLIEHVANTPLEELYAKFGETTAEAIRDAYAKGDVAKLQALFRPADEKDQR